VSGDSTSAPPAPPADQYSAAVESIRANIKWVLTSFGGVAAALIVGMQLTSVGKLDGIRLAAAIFSVVVALGAVLAVILAAVRVLSPAEGTPAEFADGEDFELLRDFLKTNQSPLRGMASSAGGLAEKYDELVGDEQAAYSAYKVNPDSKELTEKYEAAKKAQVSLFAVVNEVTKLGLYLRVQDLFKKAMDVLVVAVIVGGAGALAFAYLANPSGSDEKTETINRVVVSLDCSKTGIDKGAAGAPECSAAAIREFDKDLGSDSP
jgi:hypothetical protein